MPHRAESMQKRRKALRHNAFRRSSYLHTQEVTGSSPAVSTKQHLISYEIRCCFRLCLIAAGGFPPGVFTTQNGCMPERSGGAKCLPKCPSTGSPCPLWSNVRRAAPIRFTITSRTSMPCWTTGFKNRWTPLFRRESPSSVQDRQHLFLSGCLPQHDRYWRPDRR